MTKPLVICNHKACIARLANGSCAHSIEHERILYGDAHDCTNDPCQQDKTQHFCIQVETKWDE